MKVYAKIRQNGEYHSQNISQAVYGFREMGAEIVRYQKISDIYESVTKEDIVLDYITQVEMILKKFGVVPACEDYPVELRKFMGRNVWKDTINSINTHPEKWGVFVKPVKSKAFTGHVIRSSKDLIGCGSCYENYEVLCCDVIAPKMEWRGFIIYDELVDIRPYRGDYHYHFDAEVVDQIVEAFRTIRERPMGGSLDFAVIEKNGKLQDQTQAVTESLETKESEKEELRRKKETKDNEILLLSHKVESNTLLITHYEELEKQSDEKKDTKTAEIEVLKKETVQKKQEISNGQKKLEELEELQGISLII